MLLGDAIAAVRSRGLDFKHHREEAIALLDTWRRKEEIKGLTPGSSSRIDEPCSLEEIESLFYFHDLIRFFVNDYATNAPRPAWIEQHEWEQNILPIELSHTEDYRLSRAICRFQIHANIFGRIECQDEANREFNDWDHCEDENSPFHSADEEAWRLFFGTMPPWESHEIGCVWAYFQTKFDPVYKEITAGLQDLLEKHADKESGLGERFEFLPPEVEPPWWGDIESLDDLECPERFSGPLAAMGPDFMYRMLRGTPLVRRDLIMANSIDWGDPFIGMSLDDEERFPLLYPADRHAVEDYEQLWSTLPSFEQPNLGWKLNHLKPRSGDTFEWVFDIQGEEEDAWAWGLAIWDGERLQAWHAPILEDGQNGQPSVSL